MTDVFNPQKRREVMRLVKSKNSKAELLVFKYLRQQKVYFQKHYKRAPGTPDIALPRKKIAVFIDGDFWHGRNYRHRLKGRSSDDPWIKKIERNIVRDKEQRILLQESGWHVLRIWESDLLRKGTWQAELEKITKFLKS